MRDVTTIGEALVLLAAQQSGPLSQVRTFSKHTAGAETNVAMGLARMGMKVGWISRLGQDSGGAFLRQALQAEGIDCTDAPLVPHQRTGFMFKTRSDDGNDPQIEYHRHDTAASRMTVQDLQASSLLASGHLHVSGVFAALNASTYAVVSQAMRMMREAGKTVSFDPNLRPALWASTEQMREAIQALAAQADWVLPGLDEARLLTGCDQPSDIADFYLRLGVQHVAIKCGAQGAYYATRAPMQPARAWVAACPVPTVVDTVGAGDAFAAGFISALLTGREIKQAVERGNWMGARVVQSRGDSDGLPTLSQWQAAAVA